MTASPPTFDRSRSIVHVPSFTLTFTPPFTFALTPPFTLTFAPLPPGKYSVSWGVPRGSGWFAISAVTGLLHRDVIVTAFMCYHDQLPASVRRRVKRALELRRRTNL